MQRAWGLIESSRSHGWTISFLLWRPLAARPVTSAMLSPERWWTLPAVACILRLDLAGTGLAVRAGRMTNGDYKFHNRCTSNHLAWIVSDIATSDKVYQEDLTA